MTHDDIRAAIAADPALQALAQAGNTQAIADALSVGRTRVQSPHIVSERGILDRYAGGPVAADTVLTKLETFAASQHPMAGVVRRALRFLGTEAGLDIGAATTRMLLDQLAAGGAITADEAGHLKALALVPDPVTHTDVGAALQGA